MVALVAAPPDAAHQGSDPRPLVDAVHGAASLPGPVIRECQVVEVEVVVVPIPKDSLRMRFDGHCSLCPLSSMTGEVAQYLAVKESPAFDGGPPG